MEIDSAYIYEATTRVLSDRPTGPVDALFFHNRAEGDDTGLLTMAKQILGRSRARYIVVTNNEGERFGSDIKYEANPGKTEYIRRLQESGVPYSQILVPDMFATNVREENTAFIHLAKEQGWSKAAQLTQPHQALRAMLGAVQEMNQIGYLMELYALTPTSTPWFEVAKGSQGLEEKPRKEHIKDELGRIVRYQSTGELATFAELSAYYEARESRLLF